jgi:7-carboxy-7-deazaguanine synthase
MIISEIFGPTVQGEGPALGKRCGFVRLGRCNQSCTWCDTPYTWDWERFDPATELTETTTDAIVARIEEMGVDTVVFTGGEPLLQQRELEELFVALRDRQYMIHVETAGTLAWKGRDGLVDRWVVSPKLANSGMDESKRLKLDVLRDFALKHAAFKFVVTDVAELDEVQAIVDRIGTANVWIMPEGTDPQTITTRTAALADAVIARGWNLTTRLHVLAWGNERAH